MSAIQGAGLEGFHCIRKVSRKDNRLSSDSYCSIVIVQIITFRPGVGMNPMQFTMGQR